MCGGALDALPSPKRGLTAPCKPNPAAELGMPTLHVAEKGNEERVAGRGGRSRKEGPLLPRACSGTVHLGSCWEGGPTHQAMTPSMRPSSTACLGLRKLSRSACRGHAELAENHQ